MLLNKSGQALELSEVPIPEPSSLQVLIKVSACAVCRTDLHILDGELHEAKLPLIPGHQIVGKIVKLGSDVKSLVLNSRVGVSWLGNCCGKCAYCLNNQQNLCDNAEYTGYHLNGGFAEYCVAQADFCYPIPDGYSDLQAAPLLCAGTVGYRAYRKVQQAQNIGIYGFGSAAHILCQVANYQHKNIYAFTRDGDNAGQEFALSLGAKWAGSSKEKPPVLLDAAIIFAPIGELVPQALSCVKKGGTVICGGIHMSEIPAFSYDLLWGERVLSSVANLTHNDGIEFLKLAPKIPVETQVTTYRLSDANQALADLRAGKFSGSAVLIP